VRHTVGLILHHLREDRRCQRSNIHHKHSCRRPSYTPSKSGRHRRRWSMSFSSKREMVNVKRSKLS
jgi:hypothetical protein